MNNIFKSVSQVKQDTEEKAVEKKNEKNEEIKKLEDEKNELSQRLENEIFSDEYKSYKEKKQ